MKSVTGQAYVIARNFLVLIYEPTLDLQFPLSADTNVCKLIGWEIIDHTSSGLPTYILLLALNYDPSLDDYAIRRDFKIFTQFGVTNVEVNQIHEFARCPDIFKIFSCKIVLRSLANMSIGQMDVLLEALAENISNERAGFPLLSASLVAGNQIEIDGVHRIEFAAFLDHSKWRITRVIESTLETIGVARTHLRFEKDLSLAGLLLLGDGQYGFAETRSA
ncbi:hypothetical protein [Oryzifoliimicrobium ureilyticus]|uniref:hypothetical protein n=1 Tax=Oryzifoliimicrobium ureilyticus TaxID=3113724 RepID=UPI00307604E5